MNRHLYQTVEDRDNADQVEHEGPVLCVDNKAWFGHGYYFWDSIIDLAHWWGELRYQRNGYIICHTTFLNSRMDEVFDLLGRPELLLQVEEIIRIIQEETGKKEVFIPEVIQYLKLHTDFLTRYKAVRGYPKDTMSDSIFGDYRFKFTKQNRATLDTRPAIQVCVFDKSLLNGDFRIVYPEHYCSGMVM